MDENTVRSPGTIQSAEWLQNHEALRALVHKFNLFSNAFVSVVLRDIPACQHVLRIVTGIEDLVVREVRTQYRISQSASRDAILDVLAEDGQGRLYNLEIQRADIKDHARRTRFYGAMIDCEIMEKGRSFKEMPELHIIYISETDIWQEGKAVYRIGKTLQETGTSYEDGIHITYVNAEVDDGSVLAGLMRYFKTADPYDMSQGALSERVHFLKCEEGGRKDMCEVTDQFFEAGVLMGREKGREEGREEGRRQQAADVTTSLFDMGFPIGKIARIVSYDKKQVRNWIRESGRRRTLFSVIRKKVLYNSNETL